MGRYLDFTAPSGLRTRGTVLVVPGRGESPSAYRRFGSRLAADAYRVRVVEAPRVDPLRVGQSLRAFGAGLSSALDGVRDGQDAVRPLVLIGADLGAAAVAALTATEGRQAVWWPDGLVLAGLPGLGGPTIASWEEELDVRTHCPVHREVLRDGGRPGAQSLAEPVPAILLETADARATDLPQLVLVGEADPLADRFGLARSTRSLTRARLSVVRGAHHDVLNDLQHRSVAAEVVTFLEALRTELVPAVAVESSAW